jgi:hypothetical protein
MKQTWRLVGLACVLGSAWLAPADIIVNYGFDGGGTNQDLLNGLAARATFSLAGTHLSVLLEDTSTGVPASFDTATSLLVSVGLNLPGGVSIASGNSAVIGPGSHGLGSWSSRVAGDSVAEQWLWTNDYGGDLMEAYAQVISTSNGQGGGTVTRFDGQSGTVGGPFGGIAADPPWRSIPDNQPAVSNSILFELTLSGTLSEADLAAAANASIVEYGSDARYLLVPEPASLVIGALALVVGGRRRV